MVIQILSFLMSIIFGALMGAALLRCYLNFVSVPMGGTNNPLGQFIIALTDWLVKPLRRVFKPTGRFDIASFLAAFLLSLLHMGLLTLLLGNYNPSPVAILVQALLELLRIALQSLVVLLLIYAVMSWVSQDSPMYRTLSQIFAPMLAPIRRFIPLIGGVDLSPLVLIVLLQIGLMVVARLPY
jgi:YggT family protein